jgi:hypothetical protein
MLIRRKLVCALFIVTAALACNAQDIKNGEALLRAMHDRYQNDWYETLTFTQQSITHKDDGTTTSETWHEAMMLPGKLRVDMGAVANGNGGIFADGTVTSFKDGKQVRQAPLVHMLLVLGFDVYKQPAEKTIEQVKAEGIDLSKLHEETWQGEPVYVVGADKGDLKSKQFWVEKKRLLFVRLIEPDRRDPAKIADTRFLDYRKTSPGWVSARVKFYVDGKMVFHEEYSEIEVNPKLNPAMFDPTQFNTTHWEK